MLDVFIEVGLEGYNELISSQEMIVIKDIIFFIYITGGSVASFTQNKVSEKR